MTPFRRSIPDGLLSALKGLAQDAEPNWWRELLAHRFTDVLGKKQPLYVAFRDGYLNAYVEGQSVLKLGWDERAGRVRGEIHEKYVDPTATGQRYYTFDGERHRTPDGAAAEHVPDLEARVATAQGYARPKKADSAPGEKQGVAAIVARSPNVVDVEMALPPNPGMPRVADRIDLVALEREEGKIRIVLYEAKNFTNTSSLRAETGPARVHEQIERYEGWLTPQRRAELVGAVRKACEYHREIHLMRAACGGSDRAGPFAEAHPVIAEALEPGSRLDVDGKPRLLIMGPEVGRAGVWEPHRRKLEAHGLVGRIRVVPDLDAPLPGG
ncbi:hypothetical protein J8J14_22065 [Roseomonas sp. SSH11]|uniref:Uncharacterized protein n=1 Tax=Pararoseomonas baculiformis TaxID=2820812 RepID=A0ABS4AK92_9PROT|nr:hypothetical protein [Pararoseomonas baculiformis]MBP0447450.1 hypothetical protein [Pararoseomonas baculiformis]